MCLRSSKTTIATELQKFGFGGEIKRFFLLSFVVKTWEYLSPIALDICSSMRLKKSDYRF